MDSHAAQPLADPAADLDQAQAERAQLEVGVASLHEPAAPAVARIASGDLVSYPNTWTHWGNEAVYGMSFAEHEPLRHRYPNGPYSMIGPVEVQGAEPGDVIECSLVALRTIDWGWYSFPLGVGALPHDFTESYLHYFRFDETRRHTEFVTGVSFELRPFLGVMAVEPATDASVSAILAGSYGGNLVLNELVVGSSLFLSVAKRGGRIWLGDVHARQGDGVVDQTAIEKLQPKTCAYATTCRKQSRFAARWRKRQPTGLDSDLPTRSMRR